MTAQVRNREKAVTLSMAFFLQALLADYHPRDFTVRLWDGSQWPAETKSSRFTNR